VEIRRQKLNDARQNEERDIAKTLADSGLEAALCNLVREKSSNGKARVCELRVILTSMKVGREEIAGSWPRLLQLLYSLLGPEDKARVDEEAAASRETRIVSVDDTQNLRVNQDWTVRAEGAHPMSLIVVDNGGDGRVRGPDLTVLDLNPTVYVHRAGMSRFYPVEAMNSALSARLHSDVPFPPLEEEVD
jgi:hypothetical protein